MSQPLVIAALALALGVISLAAAKPPPSSFENPGAVVRFGHSHERVVSCRWLPSKRACAEHRGPAAAGATVSLSPVEGRLVSQPGHERVPRTISLPNREGQSAQELRLEDGAWKLSWQDQEATIWVEPQRNFSVQLKTTTGACVLDRGSCARHDEAIVRSIMVPAAFLGSH